MTLMRCGVAMVAGLATVLAASAVSAQDYRGLDLYGAILDRDSFEEVMDLLVERYGEPEEIRRPGRRFLDPPNPDGPIRVAMFAPREGEDFPGMAVFCRERLMGFSFYVTSADVEVATMRMLAESEGGHPLSVGRVTAYELELLALDGELNVVQRHDPDSREVSMIMSYPLTIFHTLDFYGPCVGEGE